jgi:hypothetical protein
MRILILLGLLLLLPNCIGARGASELAADEKGAACIFVQAESVNPFVNGSTRAAILEINTGDPGRVITPEEITAMAAAMQCTPLR